ncbi:MAG: penicillin-binding protein 1C [Akkermansiaceae bacterium]|jgi:penicillin-binding protein 1C|nr:penicillin-binding protein 1C [Akkermansiaceae bacterium]
MKRASKYFCYAIGSAAVLLIAAEMGLRFTPFPAGLASPPPGSTEFLDRNGASLRLLLVDERRYAKRSALDDISPHLIDATLSAEDRRFYHHSGIDWLANARALSGALRRGEARSGASTITQQLVKITDPGPRTIRRKLAEMWLARRVEREWSKQRILEEYLNRLDYGNLQHGIAAASRFYFDKPPADLSAAEAALLAGLPRAPGRLNPHSNMAEARQRQSWILNRMRANGRLDAEAHARASAEPLRLAPPEHAWQAPHFVDLLLQRRNILPPSGGPVRTTLDLQLNRFVEKRLQDQLRLIAEHHATSAAAVVIHNSTGEVLAMAAASNGEFQAGSGQLNGAWIIRSPGSAVKPFTYLLALERGANPGTVVADVPTDFPTPTGLYRPNNYNHRYHGPVSLRHALGNSLNVAAIRALELGGGPDALHRRLCELGLTTLDHTPEYYGPGLAIGNGEVRLLELTNAYATLGRLGIHRPYKLLENPHHDTGGVRVCDPRACWMIADMLADNHARSAAFGLNSYLAFDFPVACKTGTSSGYRDNWVVGFTPEFSVGVWVGNMDGSPMRGITGVTGAAPVMHEILEHLHETRGTTWFERPGNIVSRRIHPLTGRRAAKDQPGGIDEKCLWPPEAARPDDFDTQGRVMLPGEYAAWLASPQNALGDLVTGATSAAGLRILQPPAGTIYYLDPDLPAASQRVRLLAESPGEVDWSCKTLTIENDATHPGIRLLPGRHVLTATDAATGRRAETWIEVIGL